MITLFCNRFKLFLMNYKSMKNEAYDYFTGEEYPFNKWQAFVRSFPMMWGKYEEKDNEEDK